MATREDGTHIKGTKKGLPDAWVTAGFRFALFPKPEQKQKLERAFGCERKVYNEYVAGLYEYLETVGFTGGFIKYKIPNYTTITSKYDYLDKSNDAFVYNDAKIRFQASIRKYNEEYAKKTMQYKKSVRKKMKTIGYVPTIRDIKGVPKFHSRKQGKFSYTTNQTNGNIKISQENGAFFLYIPKFREGILMTLHRELPIGGVIKKATIQREGDRYLVSLSVDYPFDMPQPVGHVSPDKVIALDYSQKELYVDSNGHIAGYERYHKKIEKRQRRMNKSLARKKNRAEKDENGNLIYSNNYQKQLRALQRIMIRMKNKRKDTLHKKSNQISNDYDAVVVEDIDLRNMAQCLSLGKKLHDNGFGMFRTMLKYKCDRKGKHYIVADQFFPSSKLCSCCGHKQEELKLSERIYTCTHCGTKMDRDYNAALNLKQYGIRVLQGAGVTV